jgi:proline racemase
MKSELSLQLIDTHAGGDVSRIVIGGPSPPHHSPLTPSFPRTREPILTLGFSTLLNPHT